MTVAVEPFDPQVAPEEDLRALHDLVGAEYAELWAEDPLPPYDHWRKELVDTPSWQKVPRWAVWDDDRTTLLGTASLRLDYVETNRDQAEIELYVRPEARGAGRAAALLRAAVAAAAEDGRTMLNGGGPTESTCPAFCEAVGATCKIVERKSRMMLAQVDRPMLEQWIVRAKERAEGYSLLQWDGPVPEDYLEKFVALSMVMNTAPRDDLEMEDSIHTPERQRENEERYAGQGYQWWKLVARHDETDELVGFTEFFFPPSDPYAAWQEATAVDPAHRDKGLGRWLKATNCLRLLDERPDIRYVDTWNAFSNAPMLGINIAMGFEVVNSYSAYQIKTEALQARLG